MSDTARLQFEMQQLHKERNEAIQRTVRAEAERDALLAACEDIILAMKSQQTLGYFTNDYWQAKIESAHAAVDEARGED